MKIAIVGDVSKPITKDSCGGTEMWTYSFAEELVNRKHDITLFANDASKISGKLIPVCGKNDLISYKTKDYFRRKISLCTINQLFEAFERENSFDLIHISLFSFYYALPFTRYFKKPVIITVHGYGDFVSEDMVKIFKDFNSPYYVFPSKAFSKNWPKPLHNVTILHGVDCEKYTPSSEPLDYYFWIGRISEEKGVEDAILFAKKSKRKLIIAGPVDSKSYFEEMVKPHLSTSIQYVGIVAGEQKARYYKNAKAVLFTSLIKEAFGLVVVEALASGTPVITYNVDPVREIVSDKVTGFIVKKGNIQGLVEASKKIDKIDRKKCREEAVRKFSFSKMVDEYLDYYHKIM